MKKILSFFIFLMFFSLSSYFFAPDFFLFHEKNNVLIEQKNSLTESLEEFSLDKIEEISLLDFRSTPDKNFLNELISLIDASKNRVYVNMYMFTEKRLRQALLDAKKRGVDVRVLLERNVYKSTNINIATYDLFLKSGISIEWSSSDRYDLNHAKYMIVDDVWMISTGNFTYSTFTTNRDFFVIGKETSIKEVLLESFGADMKKSTNIGYHENLLMSPDYTREKLFSALLGTKNTLDIYMPYIEDEEMKEVLKKLAKGGVKVRIVTGDFDEEDIFFTEIQKLGAKVSFSKKTIHAKVIAIDSRYLLVSSINFSSSSIDENKEVGIFLKGEKYIKIFQKIFESDL